MDPKTRSEKIGELYEMVAELVAGWKTADLLATLEAADIPNGEARRLEDLQDDAQSRPIYSAPSAPREVSTPASFCPVAILRPCNGISKKYHHK